MANCIDRVWLPDEDDRLRELCGRVPLPEIATTLEHEFGHLRPQRSWEAIRNRARRLGTSVDYYDGFTLNDLSRIVGWSHSQIVEHWIAAGLLRATRIYGKSHPWHVEIGEFERFLREHPWAYDWRRFSPGPWRSKAQLISRRSPWRTVDELLAYLDLRHRNFWEKRWRTIPHQRRHHMLGGQHHSYGEPLIDVALFPGLRAMVGNLNRYARRSGSLKKLDQPRLWRRTCRYCGAWAIGQRGEPIVLRCAFCGGSLRRKHDPAHVPDRNPVGERAS